MRRLGVAVLRFFTAGAVTAVQYLTRPPTQAWVDDGLCTCIECRCPWLVGDNQPSRAPVPPELTVLDRQLQSTRP